MVPMEKVKLTSPFLKGLKPDKKMRVIYDLEQPGLSLRVLPSGKMRWKFSYRFKDRPRLYSLGDAKRMGLADARAEARKLDAQIISTNVDPQTEKQTGRRSGTFKELIEKYMATRKETMKASTFAVYSRMLFGAKRLVEGDDKSKFIQSAVLKRFGSSKATEITSTEIFEFLKPIKKEAPGTARLLLGALSGCFKWAASLEGGMLEFPKGNPCNGITKEKSKVRESVLPDELIPGFWKFSEEECLIASTVLKTILLTGQRPGEVCHMKWEHLKVGAHPFDEIKSGTIGAIRRVEYSGAWWEMPGNPVNGWPGTKNGKPHKVWLTPFVVSLLLELTDNEEPKTEGFVFKSPMGLAFSKADSYMRRICEKLGVEASLYRPHDLRRTFGTMATRQGFSREQMGRVLNHQRPNENESDRVYDMNTYLDEFRQVESAISERISKLVTEEKEKKIQTA